MASIYQTAIEQELNHLATQASSFLDRLYPAGKLTQVDRQVLIFLVSSRDFKHNLRGTFERCTQKSDTQMEIVRLPLRTLLFVS